MTKHPFYHPTQNMSKEIIKASLKVLMLFALVVGIGFVCKKLIDMYPMLAAFTHIHEYTNIFQASILSFTLLMTYLVAYALPIFIAIYFVWVFISEFLLMVKRTRKKNR